MGMFDRLLGKKPKQSKAMQDVAAQREAVAARRSAEPADAKAPAATSAGGGGGGGGGGGINRELLRQLSDNNAAKREEAAAQLAAGKNHSSMRPLMNAYMNFGDAGVLEALRVFKDDLLTPAMRDSQDVTIVETRRARLLDILGLTGDPDAIQAVRPFVQDEDREVNVHANAALFHLGDLNGIEMLSRDLQLTDINLRLMALGMLKDFDHPHAKRALDEHVTRYLAEGGALPATIRVSAPRLDDPTIDVVKHIAAEVKRLPHALTLVIGSGALNLATSRRADVEAALAGYELRFTNRRTLPEEQVAAVDALRDYASANPTGRAVLFGTMPSPHDSPPLKHFLFAPDKPYTAKFIVVDPHEYNLMIDYWRYVADKAEVPTDFEVIFTATLNDRHVLSAEEAIVYKLTPPERKGDFARAILAHL